MTRFIPVLLTIIIVSCTMAQKPQTNYDARWKNVDVLLKEKGLTASALKEVESIYTLAKKEKQEVQVIKALLYITEIESQLQEDGDLLSFSKIEAEIKSANAPVKNLLQSFLATKYLRYFNDNRWKLYDRTDIDIANDNSTPIDALSAEDLHQKISSLYLQSLDQKQILQKTSLSGYDPLIIKGNSRKLRPTLYDLLAHQALEYFSSDERDLTKPSYQFEINDEKAFAPAAVFVMANFQTSDTSSLYYHAVKLYQELLSFHLNDTDASSLLDADLNRLEFMHQVSVLQSKDQLYKNALSEIAKNNSTNEYGEVAMFLVAQLDYNDASRYNPNTSSPALRFALVGISERLSDINKKYKGTRAAARCRGRSGCRGRWRAQ